MRILRLFLILLPFTVVGQNDDNKTITHLINHIYLSDSALFVFDLKLVPNEIINRILTTHDAVDYLISHERQKSKLKRFMANTYDKWNATDMVYNENRPFRRFIYGIRLGTKWVLTYEHGGRAYHYHVIYLDVNDFSTLTTAVTHLNSDKIDDLIFNKKTQEIKSRPFKTIIEEDQFRMLKGELVKNYDLF